IEPLVSLERLRPAAAGRIDVDPLVVRDQHELRRFGEERSGEELLLPQHLEGWLARLRVRNLRDFRSERVDVGRIVSRAGQLAEVERALRAEAVGAGRAEVDVRQLAILAGARQERQPVEHAAIPRHRPYELLVDARQVVEPAEPPRLQRPLAEAKMAALL